MKLPFHRIAQKADYFLGRPIACLLAFLLVAAWLVSGPFYEFSDTWQLVMNTITSIVTFLMVFFMQNSQYRNSLAVQLKLDELLRCMREARNDLISLEDASEEEIELYHREFASFLDQWKEKRKSLHRDQEPLESS